MHKVIEEIENENSWRDGEFAKFKANQKRVNEELWCRMCTPMIYAHWEGFVISALKIMLKYLNELELKSDEVSTKLLVYSLKDAYKPLSGKQSFDQRIQFTIRFEDTLNKKVKVDPKVNTKSNLNLKVFSELCDIFDFDQAQLPDIKAEINGLVNVRNSIAHGENSVSPDQENLNNYISAVQTGIDYLTYQIEEFLNEEKYKKKELCN